MTVITRHNLCTNPSFESATTGWSTQGVHPPTIAQVSTQYYPLAGTHALQITWAAGGVGGDFNGVVLNVTTAIGTVYTWSAWVKIPTGSPRLSIWVGGVGVGTTTTKYDQWERIYITFTAAATTSGIQLICADNSVGGELTFVDAVLAEQTNDPTLPYFDGDSTGASWDGTAELSASTFTAYTTDPSLPLTVVEFDAEPPQATDFIIGTSLLDGTNVLVSNPRYVNVAALGDIITQVTITRGKTDPNGDIQPGTATIYADNWTGNFDPENTNSDYNLDPQKKLVKGMLCRISALFSSGGAYTAQTIFVGRLDNVTLREGLQPDATLTFTDDLAIMGTTSMPMFDNSQRSGETSSSRATWLYYSVGQLQTYFDLSQNAILSANLTHQLVPTYGGGSILDELNDIASAEAGRSFVDRNGVYNLIAHSDLIVQTPLATLSDNVAVSGIEFADVQASSGTLQIVNSCRAHPYTQPSPNYPDQEYTDSTSAARYGITSYNGAIGYKAPLLNSGDLLAIAEYIATRYSQPIKRYDAVVVDFTGNGPAAILLQADIGQQVVISRTIPYLGNTDPYTITSLIEGIQYNIVVDQTFTQTLITSPTDSASLFGGAGIFVIGVSLLDGSDVLSAF